MPININHAQNKLSTDSTLTVDSTNNVSLSGTSQIKNAVDPTDAQDLTTKAYVDSQVAGGGGDLTLGTPTDGTFGDGSYKDLDSTSTITDAIDDLNETIENIRNNTFVRDVDFTADVDTGGAGLLVTLSTTVDGNANQFVIDWGDGSSLLTTVDTTPSHTYNTNVGSPFNVSVTAKNTGGSGSGSNSVEQKNSFITIYTATPVLNLAAYSASSGGSPITTWDDGDTVYFENTTTNTSGATLQYTYNWGDGTSIDTVNADSDPGGVGGGRLAHTFASAGTETEVTRLVTLTLVSHSTATPSEIPIVESDSFKIYDEHTPSFNIDLTTGINEESSSGLTVNVTNTTETTIGSYSTYGIRYLWTWGDGDTDSVNTGSGFFGDTGNTLSHKYTLSNSDQANGVAQDYTGNLQVISNHSNSPFASTNFTVHLEPDVRANIAGTAVSVSDRSGDNIYDLYDGVDYNGVNRALFRATNTSQNGDAYVYDWGDSSADENVTEDGSSAGTIFATLDHDYSGESAGNKTFTFTANGTPDITAQTDSDSITVQLNSIPSAPSGLSAKSLTLQDSYQGVSPALAYAFTDNSATSPMSAGESLTSTTARRYATGTIDTNVVSQVYDATTGIVSAKINGVDAGNRTLSTTLNENGTYSKLILSNNGDAHDTISSSTYPTGFYQTFNAKITQAIADYPAGLSDQRIEHTTTGNTNYVSILRDDVTTTPTVDLTNATLTENVAGTYRTISGISYYNTGSPSLTLSGVELYNWIGQAFRDETNIFEIRNGTNYESTSGATISTQYKTYADLQGGINYITGGAPHANTGKDISNSYEIGSQTINLTTSTTYGVETIKFRAYNVNGTGSFSEFTDKKIQYHKSSPFGIVEDDIDVNSSLGNGDFTDSGLRIADFLSETTDNPSFTGSTNFYTNNLFTGAETVEGTKEATIRFGVLKNYIEDLSTDYLPAGPDRSGDNGRQYFTFAFRRKVVANFDIAINSSTGIAGVWIAAPGTGVDSASGLNGWLDGTAQYLGVGVPGSNTGAGGNGGNGCALTGGDVIPTGSSINNSYTLTLGSENMSNATGNVVLVRIGLDGFQTISSLSIEEAA